jgi:hypothetical protein
MPQYVSGQYLFERTKSNQKIIAKKEKQDALIANHAPNHGKSAYFKLELNQENATQKLKSLRLILLQRRHNLRLD